MFVCGAVGEVGCILESFPITLLLNIPINPNAFSYYVPSSFTPGFPLETTSFLCYLFILTEDFSSFQEDPVDKHLKYRTK